MFLFHHSAETFFAYFCLSVSAKEPENRYALTQRFFMRPAKTLIRLHECTDQKVGFLMFLLMIFAMVQFDIKKVHIL